MKKLIIFAFIACLILCSCNKVTRPDDNNDTSSVSEDKLNFDILKTASGFKREYDDSIDAEWIFAQEPETGLYCCIVAYDNSISLRVICTESESVKFGGQVYEISNGNALAGQALISAVRNTANGAECSFGGRDINDTEREGLKKIIALYDAAKGAPYNYETDAQTSAAETDENGSAVFDCEKFSIKYPASFKCEYKDDVLVISSEDKKPRSVTITHTYTKYSESIADPEAVASSVSAAGAELVSEIELKTIDGRRCCYYKYLKDGIYITQFYIEADDETYLASASSYEKNDNIPRNIVTTLKIK